MMMKIAVYDSKPYDKEYLSKAVDSEKFRWNFFNFMLSNKTKESAKGEDVLCLFVNDELDEECLKSLKDYGIKMIALRCAGYNNVDVEAAHKLNMPVTRVPAYSPHAVAEHAVGLLLTLIRKIHKSYIRVRDMNFSLTNLVGMEIFGKTVGVIGTGKIGKIFAEIMKGFKAKVLVNDPYPQQEWAKELGVDYVDLNTLITESDIISLHVPLLPETFHMINKETIDKMKRGVILINTCRGKVIKTADLITSLESGKIGAAALDTYEEEEGIFFEDLSDKILLDEELARLLTFPNVLITSHQAFLTREALEEIAKITVENILLFEQRKPFLPGTQL